jgi:hypothetical protein
LKKLECLASIESAAIVRGVAVPGPFPFVIDTGTMMTVHISQSEVETCNFDVLEDGSVAYGNGVAEGVWRYRHSSDHNVQMLGTGHGPCASRIPSTLRYERAVKNVKGGVLVHVGGYWEGRHHLLMHGCSNWRMATCCRRENWV